MRLGLALGYWGRGPTPGHLDLAREAERLGYASVWTAEAWGSDAFTPLTWIAAHTSRIRLGTAVAQMAARSP
ncbi:LLM class flavin-dependent oxidoreductase, partial [Streptomyces clavuligerus]